MIVRISTEGQYELNGAALDALDRLDDEVLSAVQGGDEQAFRSAFDAVLQHVRAEGRRLPDTELKESHLVLPPPDVTASEAQEMLADYPQHLGR